MRLPQPARYASALSLLAVLLSSGAVQDATFDHELPTGGGRTTETLPGPDKRRQRVGDSRLDASSSSSVDFECLGDVLPFVRYYPCREEERARLCCGIQCHCLSSLASGSSGVCVNCQALQKLATESPTIPTCQEEIDAAFAADGRSLESEQRMEEDQDGEATAAGEQGGSEGEPSPAPAPAASPPTSSSAPSPYPSFISYVPSASPYPTATRRPTVTWYPSHTWRPSVTWYPSHSPKPSASPSSAEENDGGDGGGGGETNDSPSAPSPSEEPPPTSSESSSSGSGPPAPSVPGKAAFGLIVVAAILVAIVYVVWSRRSSSNDRRHRRQALRNELELTETDRNGGKGNNSMAYDYHDRTGSYDPNEII